MIDPPPPTDVRAPPRSPNEIFIDTSGQTVPSMRLLSQLMQIFLFFCVCVCVQVFVQRVDLATPKKSLFFSLKGASTIETRQPSRTVSAPPSLSLFFGKSSSCSSSNSTVFLFCLFFLTINCRPEDKTTNLKRKKKKKRRRRFAGLTPPP